MPHTKRQRKALRTANWLDGWSKRLGLKPATADLRRRVRKVEMKKGHTKS